MVADIAARVNQGANAVCNYSIGGETFLWPRRSEGPPGMEPGFLHSKRLIDGALLSFGIFCLEQYQKWDAGDRRHVIPFLETQTARLWDMFPAQAQQQQHDQKQQQQHHHQNQQKKQQQRQQEQQWWSWW